MCSISGDFHQLKMLIMPLTRLHNINNHSHSHIWTVINQHLGWGKRWLSEFICSISAHLSSETHSIATSTGSERLEVKPSNGPSRNKAASRDVSSAQKRLFLKPGEIPPELTHQLGEINFPSALERFRWCSRTFFFPFMATCTQTLLNTVSGGIRVKSQSFSFRNTASDLGHTM